MKILFFFLVLVSFCFSATLRFLIGGGLSSSNSDIYKLYQGRRVGVITAAGSPSDKDSYLQAFRQHGITAEWIPLDAPCKGQTKDPKILDQLSKVDAIFFGGGRSNQLNDCLNGGEANPKVVTPVLQEIRKKAIVGGSSAGAMVQPKYIMLTSYSYESYSTLKYHYMNHSVNGSEVIKERVLADVHFSERGRQGRLAVFLNVTNHRWGFGVDENSCIVSEGDTYREVGRKGTWVFDNINRDMNKFIVHYLSKGDSITLNGTIKIADWKKPTISQKVPSSTKSIFYPDYWTDAAIELAKYSAQKYSVTHYEGSNPVVEVIFEKGDQIRCGVDLYNYCSITNMKVGFSVKHTSDVVGNEPLPDDYWRYDF
jgi:cyanophycinase-like exopeptidase